jgi:hypothetical protein
MTTTIPKLLGLNRTGHLYLHSPLFVPVLPVVPGLRMGLHVYIPSCFIACFNRFDVYHVISVPHLIDSFVPSTCNI